MKEIKAALAELQIEIEQAKDKVSKWESCLEKCIIEGQPAEMRGDFKELLASSVTELEGLRKKELKLIDLMGINDWVVPKSAYKPQPSSRISDGLFEFRRQFESLKIIEFLLS